MTQDTVPIREGIFVIPEAAGQAPYLVGNRCRRCGNLFFPPRAVCPACLRDDTLEPHPMGSQGTLETFSIVFQAPPGFEAPYLLGFIRLDEGPVIFSLLADCDPFNPDLAVGQRLELVIGQVKTDPQGRKVIGWLYRPTREREQAGEKEGRS